MVHSSRLSWGWVAVCCLFAKAPDPIVFDRIGLRDGLSQSTIRCIYQDSRGYLWFGTQDGLNRYDGHQFVVYRYSAQNPQTLPNNSIAGIAEDRQGTLWIATTGGGLAAFDRASESFRRVQADSKNPHALNDNTTSALLRDSKGRLWIGTQFGGLNLFLPEKNEFRAFRHDPANPRSLGGNDVRVIYEDRKGTLWVGTHDAGLDRLELESNTFTHFATSGVYSIYEDHSGRFWVGTEKGAIQLDRQSGKTTPFAHGREHNETTPGPPAVNAIFEDSAGRIWFGSETGLERFDPDGSVLFFASDMADERTLSDQAIRSIYEDRSGTLWFGSLRGINRLNPGSVRFATFRASKRPGGLTSNAIRSMYEDDSGAAWIGTDGGLHRYDPETGRFQVWTRADGLPHNTIFSIAPGRSGTLWLGTGAGVAHFDPRTRQCKTVLNERLVFRVLVRGTELWAGTRSGLVRFDTATGASQQVLEDDVRGIAESPDGTLWVATRHRGLARLQPAASTAAEYLRNDPANPASISGNAVYAVLVDHRGRVWAGTTTGLSVLDRETGKFRRYTQQDGLPNETIYGVLEDRQGLIWVATGIGLAKLNPDTGAIRSYDVSHGLQDNEFNGGAAHYAAASGHMYFGGVSGYNRFLPERLKDSSFQPPVVLTGFRVLTRPEPAVLESGSAELSWRDPMFTVEFASLDFSAPQQNRYAYKLEGFDQDWQYSKTQTTATYTNLDSGRYTFRVRATNSDGVWSPQEAKLTVAIVPPPWKRWWFLAASALILGAAFVWAYRLRVARFREAQAAQDIFARRLIESQEAERKKIAAELHDSLGQNLIVIRNHALLALAKRNEQQAVCQKLEDISTAASEAIEEVREIARSLRPQQIERLGLKNALNSIVTRAAAASSIRFTADIQTIDGLLSRDHELNLYRIVQESVNNLLKHSRATEAGLTIEKTAERMRVRIYDNGVGFDQKGTTTAQMRGMGLATMHERAKILGAHYTIESTPGQGTMILLEISLRNGDAFSAHSG